MDNAIRAYHFLKADMTTGAGLEPPWAVGEERTYDGPIVLCESGYHSSPSWYDALQYAPGPVACIVEMSPPVKQDGEKQVSRSRRLLAAVNVERELRLFACDCAERALQREREAGREPDSGCWELVSLARRYANGEASANDLAVAWDAAWDAASAVARAAAWDAASAAARAAASAAARAAAWDEARDVARDAARAVARDAAWAVARDAAWDAEVSWQRKRLDEIISNVLGEANDGRAS